jgi:lipoprotein signal peptidase
VTESQRKTRNRLSMLALAVATVGCDRVTKHVAVLTLEGEPARSYLGDTIRLGYAENTGGFLSLGAGLPDSVRTAIFTVATGLVLLALVVIAVRGRWSGSSSQRSCCSSQAALPTGSIARCAAASSIF